MNNLFSWKRFAKLFRKHTAEHYKNYLMSVLVISGILVLLLSYIQFQNQKPIGIVQQMVFFMSLLLILGTIFTSNVFTDLSVNKKAVAVLTLPASHLEKFLVAWIYSYLLFQVVYVSVFYLIIYLVLSIGNFNKEHMELFNLFDVDRKPYMVFLMYAFLHACTLLGAIIFKKWHFIKTAAVLLCFCLLLFAVNTQLLKYSLSNDLTAIPFLDMNYADNVDKSRFYRIDAVDDLKPYLMTLPILLTILLWTSSYFRLKEKQV